MTDAAKGKEAPPNVNCRAGHRDYFRVARYPGADHRFVLAIGVVFA